MNVDLFTEILGGLGLAACALGIVAILRQWWRDRRRRPPD